MSEETKIIIGFSVLVVSMVICLILTSIIYN